jgi:hypothetical protein
VTKPAVIVTDHAVLRYVQRLLGIDVEACRKHIRNLVDPAHQAGASRYSSGGMTFCLRDGKVTTITYGTTPQSSFLKGEIHNGKSVRLRD